MSGFRRLKELSGPACLPRLMLGLALAAALGTYAATVLWLGWSLIWGGGLALGVAAVLMIWGLRWWPASDALGLCDESD